MPTHNQLKDFMEARRAEQAPARQHAARVAMADASRARQTLEHPGWEMFQTRMEELLAQALKGAESNRQALVHAKDDAGARLALRMALMAEGAANALQQVLGILPDAVKAGEKAKEYLGERLDSTPPAAG